MRNIFILAALVCGTVAVEAKDIKRPDSYNYNRGVEAFYKHDMDEALKYLNKEVKDNPNNGYAYSWIADIENARKEYGRALTAADKAVKLIPKKDREYRVYALRIRGDIYRELEQEELAIQDFSQLIKEFPDEVKAYDCRGVLYYQMGQYELAEKDFRKMISLDQGNVSGYMGLGMNFSAQEIYEDAIKQFDYVLKLKSDYWAGYSFRAESYFKLGKYDEATDDIIKALSLDNGNDMAEDIMRMVADSAFQKIVSRLEIQAQKDKNNGYWQFCVGFLYGRQEDYRHALTHFKQANSITPSSGKTWFIADCYNNLGDYGSALEYINLTLEEDSTSASNFSLKAEILHNLGEESAALVAMNKCLQLDPEDEYYYHRRGTIKKYSGDAEGAIEDFTKAIALDPDYTFPLLQRCVLYKAKGDTALAYADFRRVLRLDTVPESGSVAQYAYFHLGDIDKAFEFQDSVSLITGESTENFYDLACLYSLAGETSQSLVYLRKLLELDYSHFAQLRRDWDLANVRETNEFEALLNEYETKHKESLEKQNAENSSFEEVTAEIPYIKDGGVFSVKCSINDLPLNFIFDTGASDVTMSAVEANFMMKNGYLTPHDIEGKQYYQVANGDISEGTVVNIRDVEFGGLHLSNVKASVVKSQCAPLLLGQSALQKLGKIEIDNDRKVLKVTYRKPSITQE